MGTGEPESLEAWKVRTLVVDETSGFWRVRNSTKPGRTVPSAKRNVLIGVDAPMTVVPPSTPPASPLTKYIGRSATIGFWDVTLTDTSIGFVTPCPAT